MATVSPADQARAQTFLQHALGMTGMSPDSVAALTQAALAVGAVESGAPLESSVVALPAFPPPGREAAGGAAPTASVTPISAAGSTGTPISAAPSTGSAGPAADPGSAAPPRGAPAGASVGASVDDHLARARSLLTVMESVTQAAARLDAALVLAARQQTAAIGRSLLAERDVSSPDDLSESQRLRWRARAKALSRHEIEAATGWGPGEVVDLVGLATAPLEASEPVIEAMASGVAPWRLARSFWRDCGSLGAEEAAHVAGALFGTDPDTCAPERLDPDGAVSKGPWFHREFRAALRREVTRMRSTDLAAARAAREAALASRAMSVTVDENGTGAVTLLGSALQVTAVADRIDQAARRARSAGDERTLTQLRTDIGLTLMLHGTVLPPGSASSTGSGDPQPTLTDTGVEWTPELAQALSGMPAATLQVVVPVSALHGTTPATPASRAPTPPDHGADESGHLQAHESEPTDGAPADDRLLVGQVLGAHSAFVSLDQIHDLAVLPGTVLERLLVDPADGRCVERSIDRYRPDAAMRTQILAADVTCRAPGCPVHAAACQLDHVIEHGTPGGITSETNLAPLHVGHHHPKTLKAWDSSLASNRDMTWTSLLGLLYRTRSHDYRQYATLLTGAVDRAYDSTLSDAQDADRRGGPGGPAPGTLHQIDREILLALAFRAGDESLQAGDDTVEPDAMRFGGWGFVSLTHTDDRGVRRSGPSGALLAERAAAQAASQIPSDRPTKAERGPRSSQEADHAAGASPDAHAAGASPDADHAAGASPAENRLTQDRGHRSAQRLRRDEGPPPF